MPHRWPGLLALGSALVVVGCSHKPPPAPPKLPEVTVSLPIVTQVTNYEDFTGRTDAVKTVDVKARVTGYLVKVCFKDGSIVKEGDLLYEIDPRPYEAQLEIAKGNVERFEGQKKLLETQVDRYTKLVKKGAASQQELDVYLGQAAENLGALAAAKAQAKYNDLNVKFCSIKAPLTGQLSRTYLQIGNVVNADQTLLTTLVTLDPMYAYFSVEEPTYLYIKTLVSEGALSSPENVAVRMGLADDVQRKFPLHGYLDFFNNTIDPLTGTITVRGVFPNAKTVLKPGLFARVRLPLGPPYQGLLVAEEALGTDQGQKFLYIVDADNKVRYQRVKVGLVFNGLRAIDEGLKAGDRVIVNGLQRVRPDMEVKAETVNMASLAAPEDKTKAPAGKAPSSK